MKANSEEGIHRMFQNLDDPRNSEIEIDTPVKCDHCNEAAKGEYETWELGTRYLEVQRLCEGCHDEIRSQGFVIEEREEY